ncbi:MAG: ATP-dependent DNA ligase [Actinobacteria bacterium]|nr:ATP-dependent DNA ligase [Actinomycetota bacterium]
MQYVEVVVASQRVTATSKRSEKSAILAEVLRRATPAEVPVVVGLLTGDPPQGRTGIGWSMVRDVRAVGQGAHAAAPSVTVAEIDDLLSALAGTTGAGSQGDRQRMLVAMMTRLTEVEQAHLVRLFGGEMRQGALAGVVSDAVAKAADVPVVDLRRAAMLLGDLGLAAARALAGESLAVGLSPLVAVQPMLAASATTVTDALILTGPASVEWKLDGARIQVHRDGDVVRVFTRGLNEIGSRVPAIVEAARALRHRQFVLDGEALGLDPDGNPLKFQDTMRAHSRLQPFFFDVLYLDGNSLIDEPLTVRKRMLAETVPEAQRLPGIDVAQPASGAAAAERFAATALAAGHEGVMVKALDSSYQAGRRGATWRKVKPVHTLDLVVLAAEWGHGRRTGWLSNLHLGARAEDSASTSFVMVGKTFKGLTDELLRWQTERLQQLAIGAPESGYVQHVRPELVVEIAIDGVQRSTRYPGGVALRFARVRRYRLDKSATEADAISRIQAMLA